VVHHASLKIVNVAVAVVTALIIDPCLVRLIEQSHGSVALDRALSETMFYSDSDIEQTAIIVALCHVGYLKVILVWMIVAVSAILS
jgi:hypothetical protein